jgi:hypothetical protein
MNTEFKSLTAQKDEHLGFMRHKWNDGCRMTCFYVLEQREISYVLCRVEDFVSLDRVDNVPDLIISGRVRGCGEGRSRKMVDQ